MKALVTGGAGFIGSHLVDRLLADGVKVAVLDNFSTGHRRNLQQHPSLTVIEGDVGDPRTVLDCSRDADWVFHLAAVASVPRTIEDPLGSHRSNYVGTLNVLEAARANGCRRVVFAASAAAYGDLPEIPKTEDMMTRPLSPYAVDKLSSEQICRVYHQLFGVETVCLRFFNVFGPRQDPSSPYSGVISILADRLGSGETPTIFGDGEQTRDFVYVADVVAANIQAASQEGIAGQVFNIATGTRVSLNELLRILAGLFKCEAAANHEPARAGDVRHSVADIGKAQRLLHWQPVTGLEQGLATLIDSLDLSPPGDAG